MELEAFIKEHTNLVKAIVYKSPFSRMLDHQDVSELTYIGLWKAWKKYDENKSSVKTFIIKVISNFILDIVKSKHRYRKRHVPLEMASTLSYEDSENIAELFTDREWTLVKPLYEGDTVQGAAESVGMTKETYRKTYQKLSTKLKTRLR